MSNLTIVPASAVHLPQITEIYNDAVLNSPATFDTEPRDLQDRRLWLDNRGPAHPVIVALEGDTVAGWGALSRYAERPAYRFTAEDSIYLRPEWRGQGIGSALLQHLLRHATESGLHSVVAKITEGNSASVRLHEKHGFVTVGILREVGFKFDRWLDVLMMQKTLS